MHSMLRNLPSRRLMQTAATLPNIGAPLVEPKVIPNSSGVESKPFSAIPKVKGLPVLGTILDYARSEFKGRPFVVPIHRLEEYGKIYREKPIPNGPEFVITLNPADAETVFRADGSEPHRPTFSIFDEARKKAKQERGLVLSQGKDWATLRRPLSKFMLTPNVIQNFVPDFNGVSRDLVEYVRSHKDSHTGDMVLNDSAASFFRVTYECISQFMLGERPHLLRKDFESDHTRALDLVQEFLCLAGELLFEVPFYLIYPTKKWRTAVQTQNKAIGELTKIVVDKMEKLVAEGIENQDVSNNLLLHMLGTSSLRTTTIIHNTVSLLVTGIDSTSYTQLFILYCLGKNPHIQEDLKKEIDSVWNGTDELTTKDLSKMKLLSSCIKETQRLYPGAPFNGRVTKKDLVLSGYEVPSGSTVLMPLYAMGRMKEWFDNPEVFDPYRWMKEDRGVGRFASMPFGFGARMCIGKRIAELQMKMTTAYLLKNFKLDCPQPFNVIQNVFLNTDRKVPMNFTETTH